jgi:hypothetical protein
MSPPQTTPNTAAPAVPATVKVVEVMAQDADVTWLEVRKQPVQVFDFYKGQS